MKPEYYKQLQGNWDYIIKNININITAHHLRESGVLDNHELERIKDVTLGNDKRAEKLLNMVLVRDDTTFLTFMRILSSTGQTKLYDTLERRIADAVAFGELKEQYDQACTRIETIENDLTETSNHCNFLRNLNRDYKQKVESTQRELTTAKDEAYALRKVIKDTEYDLETLREELSKLQHEKNQQTSIIEGLNNVLKSKGNASEQNEVLIRDLKQSLSEKGEDIANKNSTIDKLRDLLRSKESDIVKLENINNNFADEIRYLKENLQTSLQQKDKEIAEIKDKLDRRHREINYLRAKLEDLQALVENIDSLRQQLHESESLRQEGENRELQQKQEIEFLTRKQSDNEMQIKRLWSAVRKVKTQADLNENRQLDNKMQDLDLAPPSVPPIQRADHWANRSAPSILCQAPEEQTETQSKNGTNYRGAYGSSPYIPQATRQFSNTGMVPTSHIRRSMSEGQRCSIPDYEENSGFTTDSRKELTYPTYSNKDQVKTEQPSDGPFHIYL